LRAPEELAGRTRDRLSPPRGRIFLANIGAKSHGGAQVLSTSQGASDSLADLARSVLSPWHGLAVTDPDAHAGRGDPYKSAASTVC
jgi:hypothetical protein